MYLFYSDFEKMKQGVMAPYRHDEIPEKFSQMIDTYENWRGHFDMLVFKRDNPGAGGGLGRIEQARR